MNWHNMYYLNNMSFTAASVAPVGNASRFSPSPFSLRVSFSLVVGTCIWFLLAKQNMVLVIVFSENIKQLLNEAE